jgi:hypothetical protein
MILNLFVCAPFFVRLTSSNDVAPPHGHDYDRLHEQTCRTDDPNGDENLKRHLHHSMRDERPTTNTRHQRLLPKWYEFSKESVYFDVRLEKKQQNNKNSNNNNQVRGLV